MRGCERLGQLPGIQTKTEVLDRPNLEDGSGIGEKPGSLSVCRSESDTRLDPIVGGLMSSFEITVPRISIHELLHPRG